ncbi:hypothetical protein A4A49_52880 [Nicotiana attenuata]|uniref:Uncharacterized protein n=1 Tax=Nicotiana attenuata TaxID=49451 RepID=A0A1J6J5E1_NICAT|nr:hypothetical protein A4A49_52880 [Nicotiana attenuata]
MTRPDKDRGNKFLFLSLSYAAFIGDSLNWTNVYMVLHFSFLSHSSKIKHLLIRTKICDAEKYRNCDQYWHKKPLICQGLSEHAMSKRCRYTIKAGTAPVSEAIFTSYSYIWFYSKLSIKVLIHESFLDQGHMSQCDECLQQYDPKAHCL